MVVSTVKGTTITALEAGGDARAAAGFINGRLKVTAESVAVATTSIDEIGDIVLVCPVPMGAKLLSLKIINDDLDAHATPTLAWDVGLYHGLGTGTASGTVIDADAYGSAMITGQASNVSTGGVDVLWESTVKDIARADLIKEVWEDGGLTSNPGGFAYIGLTMTAAAATAAAGDVAMIVQYVVA